MKKMQLTVLVVLLPFFLIAQAEEETKKERADEIGQFQFGMRSSISLFDHQSYPGLGFGGQFRIRPGKRLNTEWYADYIKTDIAGLGHRETAHIGWSVMFYPLETETKKGNLTPYIIAGHCFDYAKVSSNLFSDPLTHESKQNSIERWTTAVQMGLGVNFFVSDKVDISFTGQYMSHIGNELHVDVLNYLGEEVGHDNIAQDNYLVIKEEQSRVLEGHLLMTLSVNVRFLDLQK